MNNTKQIALGVYVLGLIISVIYFYFFGDHAHRGFSYNLGVRLCTIGIFIDDYF
jgi:hypothetical protein